MIKNNKYSIRKTKIAVGSVLIAFFLTIAVINNNSTVFAEENQPVLSKAENDRIDDKDIKLSSMSIQ